MAKKIDIIGSIHVLPVTLEDPETGKELEGKKLVLVDHDAGEAIEYIMPGPLAKRIHGKLGMSNAALQAKLEEEERQAQAKMQAQEKLIHPGAAAPTAQERQAASDIMQGVRTRDN